MSAWQSKSALLVRREFWEHRALWLAPLIVGGAILVIIMMGGNVHFLP